MKKIIITLVVALALIGAVFGAAAAMTVEGVDKIGSGSSTVVAPGSSTLSVTDVSYTLGSDITVVTDVTVEVSNSAGGFDEAAGACTLHITIVTASFSDSAVFDGPAGGGTVNVPFTGLTLAAADVDGDLDVTIICEA